MTFQESIQAQERLINKFQSLFNAMSSPDLSDSTFVIRDAIQSLSSAYTAFSGLSSAIDAISQLQEKIMLLTNINYSGVEVALRGFTQAQDHLFNTIASSSNATCQTLLDSLLTTLEQAEPYFPPEEKKQCEAIIKPQVAEKHCTRLTLSDALSILSILLSVFFFVLGSMPDDQAERIIQQQNKIIANQESEIAQLRKEDQTLLDTLDSLSDSINLLANEIELLRDEIKDFDGFLNSPGQANPGESQQNNSSAQD